MSEKRIFWSCLLALIVVLPLAFAVRAWDDLQVRDWLTPSAGEIVVEEGATQAFAGGRWTLVDMRRLPGSLKEARVILAEFEAAVPDPALMSAGACRVLLTDGEGRRFEPVFLPEPSVREMYPESAELPRCSTIALAKAKDGAAVRMAESFIIPAEARDLSLRIAYPGVSEQTLVFRWKRG